MLLIVFALSFFEVFLTAQQKDVSIIYDGKSSLRRIAEVHLNNPDLWEDILRSNNIKDAGSIQKGQKIIIPVSKILETDGIIKKMNRKIEEATLEGAGYFAKNSFKTAAEMKEFALQSRIKGDWAAAVKYANICLEAAEKSIEETKKARLINAEAYLIYKKGQVDKRKPENKIWKEAELNSEFYENDRLRTMSRSLAEVNFSDKSRFRLNENSQAVILKSRMDLLDNSSENKITIEKGDAFAYLNSKSSKKKFDFDLPGIKTKINSDFFWVQKDEKLTKLANYEGEIELTASDSTVLVSKNQGTLVPKGGKPSKPTNLPDPPEVISPADKSILFAPNAELIWKKNQNVLSCKLEISQVNNFKSTIISETSIAENSFVTPDLNPGTYFWRVAAVDSFGLPGPFGQPFSFQIKSDENKPFLTIEYPGINYVSREDSVKYKGRTEKNVTVKVNGKIINIDSKGGFSGKIRLKDGINTLHFLAEDKAGNINTVSRMIICEKDPLLKVIYYNCEIIKDSIFYNLNNENLSISGKARPFTKIEYKPLKSIRAISQKADSSGVFEINIYHGNYAAPLELNLTSPAGYKKTDLIFVKRITGKLEIELESEIPAYTKQRKLSLKGIARNCRGRLMVNETAADLKNNKFDISLFLDEGQNEVIFYDGKDINKFNAVKKLIICDTSPPELIKWEIKKVNEIDKVKFNCFIKLKDAAGIRKNATMKVKINNDERIVIMNYNEETETFICEVIIKGTSSADPEFVISAEDYLNNKTEYLLKK